MSYMVRLARSMCATALLVGVPVGIIAFVAYVPGFPTVSQLHTELALRWVPRRLAEQATAAVALVVWAWLATWVLREAAAMRRGVSTAQGPRLCRPVITKLAGMLVLVSLRVPLSTPAQTLAAFPAAAVTQLAPAAHQGTTGALYHRVVEGDTLWGISQRYYGNGVDWPRIWHANFTLDPDPNLIYPGQVLFVPDTSGAPTPAAPTTTATATPAPSSLAGGTGIPRAHVATTPSTRSPVKAAPTASRSARVQVGEARLVPRSKPAAAKSTSPQSTTGPKPAAVGHVSRMARSAGPTQFKARPLMRAGLRSPAQHSGGTDLYLAVLGGSVLIGAGAVSYGRLKRRRTAQLLAISDGKAMPAPPADDQVGIDAALAVEASRHNRDAARVDQALGALDETLRPWPAAERPLLMAVTVADEAVTCWFDAETLPAGDPWEQPEPNQWVHRHLDEDAPHAPTSVVVSLGWVPATGAWCWADLMATPLVALVGARAEVLAQQWIVELMDASIGSGVIDVAVVGMRSPIPACSWAEAQDRLATECAKRPARSPWYGAAHAGAFVLVTRELPTALPTLAQGVVVIVVGHAPEGASIINTDSVGMNIGDLGLGVRLAISDEATTQTMQDGLAHATLARSVPVPAGPRSALADPESGVARPVGRPPVRILGPVEQITDVHLRPAAAQVLALLAYEGQAMSVERIAATTFVASGTVRNSLADLRRALGDDVIENTRQGWRLAVASDWALLRGGELSAHDALALVVGERREGCEQGPLAGLSAAWWNNEARHVVTAQIVALAKAYAAEAEAAGHHAEARWAALQGLKANPAAESLVAIVERTARAAGQLVDAMPTRVQFDTLNLDLDPVR
jgi:LysM repeat protein